MPYSIALAGKGGTGKTTMAGMFIKYLVEKAKTPVLAVDADANANLNEVLGLEVEETLGDAREEMKKGVSAGMTKDIFMEMKLGEAVVETDGFDLVVMGRPEGSGCYCAANTLLTQYLDRLIDNYSCVVIDNEAGMEHLSRRTTRDVQHLLIVSDATRRGLVAAQRIADMRKELEINIENAHLIVNRVPDGKLHPELKKFVDGLGVPLLGVVPADDDLAAFEFSGKPLVDLGDESPVYQAVVGMMEKILAG